MAQLHREVWIEKPEPHLNLSKSTGTLGTSPSALIHLPPPFPHPFPSPWYKCSGAEAQTAPNKAEPCSQLGCLDGREAEMKNDEAGNEKR